MDEATAEDGPPNRLPADQHPAPRDRGATPRLSSPPNDWNHDIEDDGVQGPGSAASPSGNTRAEKPPAAAPGSAAPDRDPDPDPDPESDSQGGTSPMAALEDLPAPGPDDPTSLIGSSSATRDTVHSETSSDTSAETYPRSFPNALSAGNGAAASVNDSDAAQVGRGGAAASDEQQPMTRADDVGAGEPEKAEDPEGPGGSKGPGGTGEPVSPSVWVSLDELDELTIVARAQDGDPQAFDWLIRAYQGGVYRLCYRMLNDRSDAEDIVQETFIAAWRNLPKHVVPQVFIPWLYRTATNKCLDHLRRRKRRPAEPTADLEAAGTAREPGYPSEQGPEHESGHEAGVVPDHRLDVGFAAELRGTLGATQPLDPAQDFENQAQLRALADLLQTLPPGPRACWLLREVHEFSYLEIAAIVQLPESTVRGRIARAKRFLAEGMAPWR